MYYIDTNILIYANSSESTFHKSASKIFFDIIERKELIIHEIVLAEFFAVITDSRKMRNPWAISQAKKYIKKLYDVAQELHFLNMEILKMAFAFTEDFNITRYNIYDHLLAYSMKFFNVEKLVTLNKKDFEKYSFIKEICVPT